MSFPSLPLFVDDFEAATVHLSLEEDGAYNRLLRLNWRQSDCSIPADDEWITRRMRVDSETYHRVVKPILAEFFTRSRGRWFQKRLREEHAFVRARTDARAEAGRRGGNAKAAKTKETPPSNATILPEQNSSKRLAPTLTLTPIPIREETEAKASVGRKRAETELPPEWVPNERNVADAEARGFSQQEISDEADRFRDHHLARGSRFRDWNAAWRTWLGNARKFANGRVAGGAASGGRGPGGSLASIAAWRRASGAV
jgi:uncharacterized protein YdaU (DUF1376 family)